MDPVIVSVAAQMPPSCITTEELLHKASGHLSDKLRAMMAQLGIDRRYSVLSNLPEVLFEGAEPQLAISASALAVQCARRCLEKVSARPEAIGLVLGVTSSPSRLMPSLVCDMFAQMPELPRDAATLAIEYMGCSALAKVVDVARWYLQCYPKKLVLVTFMDAITPLSPPLPLHYKHFSEVSPEERQNTVDAMHGFLFADASVAMLLGGEGGGPSFGPVVHLTNDRPEDAELGTVPDGGSDIPVVHGRRLYTLSPDVSARGTYYATRTVTELLANASPLTSPSDASILLMHTGSRRILDGLCASFGVPADGEAVASSYKILRDFGNTIGCSVPLMLADTVYRPEGIGLMVAFGLSFSCGACTINIPRGGWTH